jgi:glycosyltransferase involved in cell wall biosynthesis
MRILFISHYSELYGANKSLLALMRDLNCRYGIECTLLCVGKGAMVEHTSNSGIGVITVDDNFQWCVGEHARFSFGNNILRKIKHVFVEYKILGKVEQTKFDVVHCNTSVTDLGAFISKKTHTPLVWHLREYGDLDYGAYCYFSDKYRRKKLESADALIAISSSIQEYYRKIAPNGRFELIYNGVREFDVKKTCVQKKEREIQFCCIGVLYRGKNQLEILEAATYLKQKYHMCNYKINLIGDGDVNYEKQLKEYIKENSLDEIVEFYGYKSDIANILSQMDVGIMCSKSEAFGRVTIEYMFSEMPVIGTNSGGTPEIIVPDETGYLYDTGNPEQLAEYMRYFIDNKEEIKRLGTNGRKRAIEKFSVEANTDCVYHVYKSILENIKRYN